MRVPYLEEISAFLVAVDDEIAVQTVLRDVFNRVFRRGIGRVRFAAQKQFAVGSEKLSEISFVVEFGNNPFAAVFARNVSFVLRGGVVYHRNVFLDFFRERGVYEILNRLDRFKASRFVRVSFSCAQKAVFRGFEFEEVIFVLVAVIGEIIVDCGVLLYRGDAFFCAVGRGIRFARQHKFFVVRVKIRNEFTVALFLYYPFAERFFVRRGLFRRDFFRRRFFRNVFCFINAFRRVRYCFFVVFGGVLFGNIVDRELRGNGRDCFRGVVRRKLFLRFLIRFFACFFLFFGKFCVFVGRRCGVF